MPVDPFSWLGPDDKKAVETTFDRDYAKNPEWQERWGDYGRQLTLRDMGFHVMFLRDALALDAPEVFTQYTLWCAGVLEARDVEAPLLVGTLDSLADTMVAEGLAGADVLRQAAVAVAERDPPAPWQPDPHILEVADHLLSGEAKAIMASVDEGDLDTVLMSAMVDVGERWARNEISVAMEHVATATCQLVLAHRRMQIPTTQPKGRVALACVPSNQHDLGLRALANICDASGLEVTLLGADVPTDALIDRLRTHKVDTLVLSAALPHHVLTAKQVIHEVRAEVDPAPRITVGGNAFHGAPELWRFTGADGGADAPVWEPN